MTKKLIAALMGTLFAIGALSGSVAFADDGKDKKETTKEETKK
jgi:hypothetical protein